MFKSNGRNTNNNNNRGVSSLTNARVNSGNKTGVSPVTNNNFFGALHSDSDSDQEDYDEQDKKFYNIMIPASESPKLFLNSIQNNDNNNGDQFVFKSIDNESNDSKPTEVVDSDDDSDVGSDDDSCNFEETNEDCDNSIADYW